LGSEGPTTAFWKTVKRGDFPALDGWTILAKAASDTSAKEAMALVEHILRPVDLRQELFVLSNPDVRDELTVLLFLWLKFRNQP
jgi:hypothetical protein